MSVGQSASRSVSLPVSESVSLSFSQSVCHVVSQLNEVGKDCLLVIQNPLGKCLGHMRHFVAREVAALTRQMPLLYVYTNKSTQSTWGVGNSAGGILLCGI